MHRIFKTAEQQLRAAQACRVNRWGVFVNQAGGDHNISRNVNANGRNARNGPGSPTRCPRQDLAASTTRSAALDF